MNRKNIFTTALLLFLTSIFHAQEQTTIPHIYVESWHKGTGLISEQVLNITLKNGQSKFESCISNNLGEIEYKMVLLLNPVKGIKRDFWGVELHKINTLRKSSKASFGDNMVSKERPGPGGDNFPREDYVGYLYPVETPKFAKDELYFYPIMSKRVIKIEGFYLIVVVKNYKMNEKNPDKLDQMDISIEFKNVFGNDSFK